jgi:hypothetical protein
MQTTYYIGLDVHKRTKCGSNFRGGLVGDKQRRGAPAHEDDLAQEWAQPFRHLREKLNVGVRHNEANVTWLSILLRQSAVRAIAHRE